MSLVLEIAAAALLLPFLFFLLAGLVGLWRMGDAYSRLQAGGLIGTSAMAILGLVLILLAPDWRMALRLALILTLYLISSPLGSHIVARFIWTSGQHPWRPPE